MAKKDEFQIDEFDSSFKIEPLFGKEERYLPSRESSLSKVLKFLNRANSAKNDLALGALRGTSASKIVDNIKASLSGKRVTEGTQVVDAFVGKQKKGAGLGEKVARGGTGFLFDVVTDPLNLVGVGAFTKAGSVVRKGLAGSVLRKSDKAASFAEGLKTGERSLLSIAGLHSPEVVNRVAGSVLQTTGSIISALPGAKAVKQAFKPMGEAGQKLAGLLRNKQKASAEEAIRKVAELDAYAKSAALSVEKLPKERLDFYRSLNYTNEQIANAEVAKIAETALRNKQKQRLLLEDSDGKLRKYHNDNIEAVKAELQSTKELRADDIKDFKNGLVDGDTHNLKMAEYDTKIKGLEDSVNQSRGVLDVLRNVSVVQKLNRIDKKIASGKVTGQELDNLLFRKSELSSIVNQVKSYNAWALANNGTTKEIAMYARDLIQKDKELKKLAIESGAKKETDFIKRGFFGRVLSPQLKEISDKGSAKSVGPLAGVNLGRRQNIFSELTTGQTEKLFAENRDLGMFVNTFGVVTQRDADGPLRRIMEARGLSKEKLASFYETNPVTSYATRLLNTTKAVNSIEATKELLGSIAVKDISQAAKKTGADWSNYKAFDVPEQYQTALGAKKLWVPMEVEEDLTKAIQTLSSPKEINMILSSVDNAVSVFKRIALFGTPIVSLPVVIRNLIGGVALSRTVGAVSPSAFVNAGNTVKHAFSNSPLIEGVLKTERGDIPLAEAYDFLKKNGVLDIRGQGEMADISARISTGFQGSKFNKFIDSAWITGAGQKANNAAEIFNRSQHFFARVEQGWTFERALQDTIKTQYNYAPESLSAVEREVMRRVFPFYTWMRRNLPAQIENAFKHPGKLSEMQSLINDVESTAGNPIDGHNMSEDVWPEYINKELHMRIGFDKEGRWKAFRLRSFLPVADLESVLSASNLVDTAVGSMTPVLKVPYELATGRSTFFKTPGGDEAPIERYPGEKGTLLGITVPKRVESVITQLARPIGTLDRLNPMGVFGTERGGKQELSNADKILTLLAVKPVPINPEQAMKNAIYSYDRKAGELNSAYRRAEKLGRQMDAENILRQIDELQARSRVAP